MRNNNTQFPWDGYSDQPHIIKDKSFKKEIYKKAAFDQVKTLFTTVLIAPFITLSYFLLRNKRHIDTETFFGMSVNLDKEPKESHQLIQELGVESLAIRLPLEDIDNLESYVDFIAQFPQKEILVIILQNRENIENLALFQANLVKIFKALPSVTQFQIGNAINRKKWAFFTIKEYLHFYQTAQIVRDTHAPDVTLLGSSVIDFEYHYTVRSLFNLIPLKFDIFTSLLYVDRRGSPESKQMGFDLYKKIRLLNAIMILSPKTRKKLFITETNWPISNTAPYAPTSEKECVSHEDYARYMVQYYLIALATKQVERVYWHQLIAPGYGLIDNREGLKKYPAFKAYQTMVQLLKGASLKEYNLKQEIKFMRFTADNNTIMIHWSDTPLSLKEGLDIYGEPFKEGRFSYHISALS